MPNTSQIAIIYFLNGKEVFALARLVDLFYYVNISLIEIERNVD
jgi:hypothetical protein